MYSRSLLLLTVVAFAGASVIPSFWNFLDDERIVGGEETEIEKVPYQLSLQYKGNHFCGASIISEKWALTAAHCVDELSAEDFTVRVGSSYKNKGGQLIQVASLVPTDIYDPEDMSNDYALIKLATPITLGPTAKIITLASKEAAAGADVTVSGWGALISGGEGPDKLNKVTVNMISRKQCEDYYNGFNLAITKEMICAMVPGGGKDSCQGDSGGPLVDDSTGQQVGIVSWGLDCGGVGVPGVYSNVANPRFRKWVSDNTGIRL